MADATTILDKLEAKNIFYVTLSEDKKSLKFGEACDHYYEANLNKNEAYVLLLELKNLINQMEGEIQ